jgi:hypothetical protein
LLRVIGCLQSGELSLKRGQIGLALGGLGQGSGRLAPQHDDLLGHLLQEL